MQELKKFGLEPGTNSIRVHGEISLLPWQAEAIKILQTHRGTLFCMLANPRRVGRNFWTGLLFACDFARWVLCRHDLQVLEKSIQSKPGHSLKTVFIPASIPLQDWVMIQDFAQRTGVNVVFMDCEAWIPLTRKIETCTHEEFDAWMEKFKASKP